MAKATCESLAAPLEVLELHDAAHASANGRLHRLARRLMAVSGIEHLSVGSDLDDAAGEASPLLIYETQDEVPGGLLESGLYDVCLLRRTDERALADGSVIVGTPVGFVAPIESGSRRFPVVATPCAGEIEEVHVEEDGQELPRGVWLVSRDGETPTVHDCLARGVEQVHRLPLLHRIARLPSDHREAVRRIERPSDLCDLPKGRWLLRTCSDPSFDRTQPFGLLFDAQAVRPGQYVRPPKPSDDIPVNADMVRQRIPSGLRCQLHKRGGEAWLFVGDRAVDCLDCLPQARAIIEGLGADSVVLDCVLVPDRSPSELGHDLRRGNVRARIGLRFVAIDCLYRNGEDLHEEALTSRLEALRGLGRADGLSVAEVIEETKPGVLMRPADSRYPLDWSGDGWYRVPEERRRPTQIAEPVAEEASTVEPPATDRQEGISRDWFETEKDVPGEIDVLHPFWIRTGDGSGECLHIGIGDRCLRIVQSALDGDRFRAYHLDSVGRPEDQPDGVAILGVQRDDMHEVFLVFDEDPDRSGRYVWQWSDEDGTWRCWKPKWQCPHLMTCEYEEEARAAQERHGWVAWNPHALQVLASSRLSDMLPLNWESAFEEFEYQEDVDFQGVQV